MLLSQIGNVLGVRYVSMYVRMYVHTYVCMYVFLYVCMYVCICVCTVQTFNSCTKCVGSPGMIHDRMSDCHPVSWSIGCMDYLTTESSFDSHNMWVIGVLGLHLGMLYMGFVQPGTGRRPVDWCNN